MVKRRDLVLRAVITATLAVIAFVVGMRSHRRASPPPESADDQISPTPVAMPSAPVETDADASSVYGVTEAAADLEEDRYIHKAFVAVDADDATVWKDRDSNIRTTTGLLLCEKCFTTDFVVTNDRVAWIQGLEVNLPGFNATVRTFPLKTGWRESDGGEVLSYGDRAASLNNASDIATDGAVVYVVEGKEDAAHDGYEQNIVRVDLAKKTTTPIARMPAPIRTLVYSSGELFVTWSAGIDSPWRVQAIRVKKPVVRDVVKFTFPLPEEAASSTDLYFVYRDADERTSKGHIASVPLEGGAITNVYETAPNEMLGCFAADDSGFYVARFLGQWKLTRFANGKPPQDLATFAAMPRAIALRSADIAVAFLDELKIVPK